MIYFSENLPQASFKPVKQAETMWILIPKAYVDTDMIVTVH